LSVSVVATLLGGIDFPSSADHSQSERIRIGDSVGEFSVGPAAFQLLQLLQLQAFAFLALGLSAIGHAGSVAGLRCFASLVARD